MSSGPSLSLALRSHLAVYPQGCVLRRHDGFWSVATPGNPSFWWGNFLQFDGPPQRADASRWPALFAEHMAAGRDGVDHVALRWEGEAAGDVGGFPPQGYTFEESVVMVAPAVRAAPAPSMPPERPATLRALRGDADWHALLEFNVRTRDAQFGEAAYRRFSEGRLAHLRPRCEGERGGAADSGVWVGAWVEGELAATLAVLAEPQPGADGRRIARYQEVTTDERWRRRGLCSALLPFAAAQLAPAGSGIGPFVIVADANDVARHVYAARGFEVVGRWQALVRG